MKVKAVPRFLIGWLCLTYASVGDSGLRVVRSQSPSANLLQNGDFERGPSNQPIHWHPAPEGCQAVDGEGRSGSRALVASHSTGQGWVGASQTVTLNRTNPAPLVVRGSSRAADVTGAPDSGYSLYVDILYQDGTPLWGRTANFRCGTHDWESRELIILPEKPVKTVTVHCLFRGHAGTVWFDDVQLEEVTAPEGAVLFQGVPVHPQPTAGRALRGRTKRLTTQDGLALAIRDQRVTSWSVAGEDLAGAALTGFLARDAAANSDFHGFDQGRCHPLGLQLETDFLARSNHVAVEGRLTDTTGRDRAVTLVFALPLEAAGWHWGDDIRRSRVIGDSGEFANLVTVAGGATGTLSLYPLAAVWNQRVGLALALDMGQPAQYRLTYHAGTRQLFIAYDFGLVPDTARFPSAAAFRFVLYRFTPAWGFRSAFQKLTEIFPEYFVVRSPDQGLWMPFTDVSTVENWRDFGFKYHEGNNNVTWDDDHEVLSFRYTEPMTWWMPMQPEGARTPAEAVRVRDEWAQSTNERHRQMAQVSQAAAMFDETGQPALLFRNEPWCNGAVWSLNPNPHLGALPSTKAKVVPLNAATVHWHGALKARLYGPGARGVLDGEYLDSLEGYVTAELNFRREHFRYSTVPLTFRRETQQPSLFKGLAVFEFTRWISDEIHALGRLTFANGVPYRFSFLCPWLDVLGTETDWLRGGRYQPPSDATMSLWRTMAGRKPYLLLQNTDYDAFTPELVERYFQRALFYGMWPSMFSHNAAENPYWQNPKWYNRDRALFRQYIPVIKRVAQAGWQPVTGALCDDPELWVERFGPDVAGTAYFTLFNDTARTRAATLNVTDLPRVGERLTAYELLTHQALEPADTGWSVTVPPQQVRVVQVLGL